MRPSDVQASETNARDALEETRRANANEDVKAVAPVETDVKPSDVQASETNARDALNEYRRTTDANESLLLKTRKIKEPVNSSMRILQLSEGLPKRLKSGLFDKASASVRSFKLDVAIAFGQRGPSKYFTKTAYGRRAVASALARVYNNLTVPSINITLKLASKQLLKTTLHTVLETVDFLDNISDFSQLVGDSVFYNKFPDVSSLISPSELRRVFEFSVDKQYQAVIQYNSDADTLNTKYLTMTPAQQENDYGYPYAYAKYPMIMGPLDVRDSANARGDAFWVQTRVQTEIDSIRELMVRDPNSTFSAVCKRNIGTETYSDIIQDPNLSLVSYIDDTYGQTDLDDLYRYAFTFVCSRNDGVVYEDVYPEQKDSSGNIITPTHARFQCGYKNSTACKTAGDTWYNSPAAEVVGNYAEWYTVNEINTTLNGLTPSRPSIDTLNIYSTTTSNGKPSSPVQASSMCIVTNSGVRNMCNRQKTNSYNPDTHTCTFTLEYCKTLGTCYDSSTSTCYLPDSPGFKTAEAFFGQGGIREWISINGCEFMSGKNIVNDVKNLMDLLPLGMFFTGTGESIIDDMFKNHKNWNEGFKQTMKEPLSQLTVASIGIPVVVAGAESAALFLAARGGAAAAAYATQYTATMSATAFQAPLYGAVSVGATVGIVFMAVIAIAMVGMTVDDILNNRQEAGLHVPFSTKNDGTALAEYTCTGWQRRVLRDPYPQANTAPPDPFGDTFAIGNNGNKLPKMVTFIDGWVTKPLLSKTGSGVSSSPASMISQINGTVEGTFYSDNDTSWINYVYNTFGKPFGDSFGDSLSQYLGYPGFYDGTTREYVTKKFCSKDFSTTMWRSGSRSSTNQLWCLPEQPPVTWADPSIGPLAKIISLELSGGTISVTKTPEGFHSVSGVSVIGGGTLTDGLFLSQFPPDSPKAIIRNPVSTGTPPVWSFGVQTQRPVVVPPMAFPAGTRAEIIESEFAKNRSWTDGTDPTAPNFPQAAGPEADTRNDRTNDIYYQLVYDKSIVAPRCQCSSGIKDGVNKQCVVPITGSTPVSGTCATGQTPIGSSCISCPTGYDLSSGGTSGFTNVDIPGYATVSLGCIRSCMTLPSLLFDNTTLSKHFNLTTINSMRQTMCQEQFMNDLSGKTVDSKCWGYLSVGFNKFTFLPMTVGKIEHSGSTICDPGRYRVGNSCVDCPNTLPSGSQWVSPGTNCDVSLPALGRTPTLR